MHKVIFVSARLYMIEMKNVKSPSVSVVVHHIFNEQNLHKIHCLLNLYDIFTSNVKRQLQHIKW